MAWNDRIREAAYTPPSGTRLTFTYEDVSRQTDKKTTGYEFPDADGTYVQDLGRSGRRYPLRVIFWGENCDTEADAFEAALLERGPGRLEHPMYGLVEVVPFGQITRTDNLKTGANESLVEVTFWETIGVVYPAAQVDRAGAVLASVEEYNAAAAGQFETVTSLGTEIEEAGLKHKFLASVGATKAGLQKVADTQDSVRTKFNTVATSINSGISLLIADPLTLAYQTLILIQAPARALSDITARLSAYKSLLMDIISGAGALFRPGVDSQNANEFYARDLFSSTYITGAILSVVNNEFTTKREALEAAETILGLFNDLSNWRDLNYSSLGAIDTGAAYQKLQAAVAITTGYLVEISFTLKQERRITLDRARTIVDLAAELYGSVDDKLDFLINTNNLTGSEILELPRGRKIVYYV